MPGGQIPSGRGRQEQSRARRLGNQHGRRERITGPMDHRQRRGKILAIGLQRTEKSRHARLFHRLRGRPQRTEIKTATSPGMTSRTLLLDLTQNGITIAVE